MNGQNNSPKKDADFSSNRMTRGEQIAKEKAILENGDGSFSVPSQTVEEIAYLVRFIDGKFLCNCMDFRQRGKEIGLCKHIHAVRFWVASQTFLQEKPKPKIFSPDSIQCQKCGSIRVVKFGHDSGKQVFKCKDCSHKFRETSLLKKAQFTAETIALTLDLYFSGLSMRKIARTISDHYNEDLSYGTVYIWIQRYIPRISEFVNSLAPQLSDTWHADELFVKMKHGIDYKTRGKKYDKIAFLWNVMDRKTRYMLASKLSPFRDGDGATRAFKEARANAHGQEPEKVFTDSLRSYTQGADYAWTDPEIEPKLIQNAGISKPHATNNRIERANGTLRERVKVQRGWKSFNSQISEGQRIHYNFVKPHQALEGMTPAQRAGIGINGKNKWMDLLELAMQRRQ